MLRRIVPLSFGFGVGIAARFLLNSHHSVNLLLTITLSLAGSVAGQIAAEQLLPRDCPIRVYLAVTTIGALAMLLAFSIVKEF